MNPFRVDLHVHTQESSFCGRTAGRLVTLLYKKAGYDGIVITDHYSRGFFRKFPKNLSWSAQIEHFLRGYRSAREEGEKIGLKVWLGIELKFTESPLEFLVFGLDESFLKEYPELFMLGIKKFRDFSKQLTTSEEILIYQAHPFRPGLNPVAPGLIDGIEVYNGNPRQNSNNELAVNYARQHRLRMISGSDFHRLPDLGRGGVILPEPATDTRSLVRILKEDERIRLITAPSTPRSFLRLVNSAGNIVRKLIHSSTGRCNRLR
jgi:hypothetical protein